MKTNKEFKEGLKAAERVAKLLMAGGKLTGWVTRGEVIKAMGGDRKATTDALEIMEVYGFCKTRSRNGGIIYGISTKPEVQARNLEELTLKFKNQQLLINDSVKNTNHIVKLVKRRVRLEKVKSFYTKLMESWKAFLTGLKETEK